MSEEILSQEEIDALLAGLDPSEEQEDDSGPQWAAEEVLFDAVGQTTLGGLPMEMNEYQLQQVAAEKLAKLPAALSGEIEMTGKVRARSYYHLQPEDLEVLRQFVAPEEEGVSADEQVKELIEQLMEQLCMSLAAQLTDVQGEAVDLRAGPPAEQNLYATAQTAGNWYALSISLAAQQGEQWQLHLTFTEETGHLLGIADCSPQQEDDSAVMDTPAPAEQESYGSQSGRSPAASSAGAGEKAAVKKTEFPDLQRTAPAGNGSNLEMLLDVPLEVTVELGRTVCDIRDILSFSSGSVVELDKQAGDLAEIMINGKLIARGEVVVVDEDFAVRITEIVSLEERIKNLQ